LRLARRKAISEIIAALLLICITVAVGTLFAAYASGLMGRIEPGAASQPYTEQLSVEYYEWPSNTLSSLTIDVRNTGVATVNLQTADYYLSGIQLTTAPTFTCVAPATSTAIAPTGVCQLVWNSLTASSYTSGIAYVLKIVLTKDGATFTFSVVAGSTAAPSCCSPAEIGPYAYDITDAA